MTSFDQVRDLLARAATLRFTDVVFAWPRTGRPFEGDERLLDGLAEALPELRRLGD